MNPTHHDVQSTKADVQSTKTTNIFNGKQKKQEKQEKPSSLSLEKLEDLTLTQEKTSNPLSERSIYSIEQESKEKDKKTQKNTIIDTQASCATNTIDQYSSCLPQSILPFLNPENADLRNIHAKDLMSKVVRIKFNHQDFILKHPAYLTHSYLMSAEKSRNEKMQDGYILREIIALKILKNQHENIICMLQEYHEPGPAILLPYYPLSNFYNYFKSSSLDISTLHIFLLQMTSGLTFIHENNIIHGDISPVNVMIYDYNPQYPEKIHFKIIDFGHCCTTPFYDHGQVFKINRLLGTPQYQAPEIDDYKRQQFFRTNHSFDIYALGKIVKIHFSSLLLPSDHTNTDDIIKKELIKRTCKMACNEGIGFRIQAKNWYQQLLLQKESIN